MVDAGDTWGQLIPLFGDERSPIEMKSDLFSIGRKKTCDLCLSAFPVVSGYHCSVIRDPEGQVWLQDSSTNGTVINSDRKLLDDVCEIEHNTEFHLIFRRNAPSECIGFRYENISELQNSTNHASNATIEEKEDDKTQEMINEIIDSDDNEEIEADSQATQPDNAAEEAENEARKDLKRALNPNGTEGEEESNSASKRTRQQPPSPQPGPSNATPEPSTSDSGLLETLICAICHELLYDCVSVQPCLHSFCAGCFSDWMQGSCPQCRKSCTRVSKNHLVNNVIEEYLKKHPDQQRCQEDRDDLDRRNKIKDNVVNLSRSHDSDFTGSDDSESDSPFSSPTSFNHLPIGFASIRPVCRQCPNATSWSFRNGPPVRPVVPPPYVCDTIRTTHVLCQCCLEAMPQRLEPDTAAKQRCAVCRTYYCRQYFGCSNTCNDCLMPIKDANLTGPVQFNLIMRNSFETRILLDYMREKSITLRQLMNLCAENLTTRHYYTPSTTSVSLTSESLVCRQCSHHLLRDFAYHYRASIDPTEFPAVVRNRPDCRWGRNCRTQVRPHHAERYNHICEQTQFEAISRNP